MRLWILLGLLCISPVALSATDVEVGCQRLHLALDPRLTPEIVDQAWGSGVARDETPAALQLFDCDGRLLDRFDLEVPLARMDPTLVHGAPASTFLVSTDLTREAGTYNGPLTILLQVNHDHLSAATVRGLDGTATTIHLTQTGKASWKKINTRSGDQFLQVESHPVRAGFETSYRRFLIRRKQWIERTLVRPGLWESDGEFPSETLFPDASSKPNVPIVRSNVFSRSGQADLAVIPLTSTIGY